MGYHDVTNAGGITLWRSVTDVFDDQVRTRPNALAVEALGQQRSYSELSARVDAFAARLADHLGEQLYGAEQLIGVCLVRDVDLPAWLLAILKIGAAYFPIDPTTPEIRVTQMLEDAQPAFIVASRHYASIVARPDVAVMIAEDEPQAALPTARMPPIRPERLAYVIFTSGSTGRPKGVEIEHGSLAGLLAAMVVTPGLAAGERMLGLTRVSFDLSVPDMFLPFYVGASLSLVGLDVAADPERLAAAFKAYQPDLAQATPSTWRGLLESGWQGHEDLRIVAGGESVTRALADALLPCCKEVWNIYGPTETTVWSTACQVLPGSGPVPIGAPMTGYQVHVAGPDGAPLPDGTVGEIVIGGGGVARGYRNRPELTAERFILLNDGSRAYRTGDLGRIEDAALYCLGRLDDQVKVRGFRIELGDIEAALAHHPAVAWGAVRLWTDPSGEPVLVAYIVPRPGETPSARAVKQFLASRIALYMIPDRIVNIAAMPLTPNGKIDRAALARPFVLETVEPTSQSDSTLSTRLAAIWCELLGLGAVGEQDDFFDLGGYSLMTVRLTRRIEAEFGVRLALIELMQHSTLGAMSARIALGKCETSETTMLLNAGGDRPPLFWLDAGPLMRIIMRGLSPGQPAFALNTNPHDEEAFGDGDLSIPAIAAYLRTRLVACQPHGPYYIGGWCRWGIVAFELARQLRESGERVALLTLLDAERSSGQVQWGIRRRVKAWLRTAAMPTAIEAPQEPRSFSQRVELATRDYVAGPYDGDVLLLRPEGTPGDAGWGAVVTGRVEVARVPGDHVSMVRGASALALAAHIDKALRAAQHELADLNSGRQRDPIFDRGLAEQACGKGAYRRPDVVAG